MGTSGLTLRAAADADLPAIAALYGAYVRTGAASFEYDPPDLAEMQARLAAVRTLDLPWLVAELEGRFAGYAYAGPFRLRPGYRYAVEDTVYVDPDSCGRGVGRALLEALIARCERDGLRQMVAVIGDSAANAASIAVHRACGFSPAGTLGAVGWKHDGWRDVAFMQRSLGPGAGEPPSSLGLALR